MRILLKFTSLSCSVFSRSYGKSTKIIWKYAIYLLKWDGLKPSTQNLCNSPRTRQHSGSRGSLGRLNFLPGLMWLYSKTVQTCSNYVWKSLELSNNTKAYESCILDPLNRGRRTFWVSRLPDCFMRQKPLCGRQCPYKISAADWDVWRHWVKRTTHTHTDQVSIEKVGDVFLILWYLYRFNGRNTSNSITEVLYIYIYIHIHRYTYLSGFYYGSQAHTKWDARPFFPWQAGEQSERNSIEAAAYRVFGWHTFW